MIDEPFSRRHFFYGALLAGAVPRTGFGSAASLKQLGYKSPNEKLSLAVIGAGGRATANISGCASENFVAFADPDDSRAAETYKKYEKAAKYKDFRRMLDKEGGNVDAVIITIPDHMHATAAIYCMERGKHVYVEKPLTRTIWEARFLTQAAAKYKVATQMGNQGYSNDGARIAAEIIWSGEIGDVTEVHCWTDRPIWPQGIATLPPEEKVPDTLDWDLWLGPAAMRPYSSAYLPFNWRGWFDFGSGALGDIACHVLGAVNIALRLGGSSCTVEVVKTEGKNEYTFPKKSVTEFRFPARGALAPVRIVWSDAAEGPSYRPEGIPPEEPLIGGEGAFGAGGVMYTGGGPVASGGGRGGARSGAGSGAPPAGGGTAARGGSAYGSTGPDGRRINFPNSSGAVFVGTKGYLTSDTYGANVRLLPQSRNKAYKLPQQVLARSPGHYQDWIRACKGIEPEACSNFAISGPFTEIVQLASVALHFEGKLEWNSAKMQFTNNAAANEFVKPKFRKGWQIG